KGSVFPSVIPAQAGIHRGIYSRPQEHGIPVRRHKAGGYRKTCAAEFGQLLCTPFFAKRQSTFENRQSPIAPSPPPYFPLSTSPSPVANRKSKTDNPQSTTFPRATSVIARSAPASPRCRAALKGATGTARREAAMC